MLQLVDQTQQSGANRETDIVIAFRLCLIEHKFSLLIHSTGPREGAPDIISAKGIVPWAKAIAAGCLVTGPERLIHDVP